MTSTVDKDRADQARQLVQEALGVLMRGISPAGHARERAQIAIREIAHVLYEGAMEFELDADLTAALFDVGIGSEPELPPYLRRVWENRQQGLQYVHPVSDKDQGTSKNCFWEEQHESDSMTTAAAARDRGEPCGRQVFST